MSAANRPITKPAPSPPPKKSSTVIVGEDGRTSTEKDTIERDDFWATTSNKPLNFVQYIRCAELIWMSLLSSTR